MNEDKRIPDIERGDGETIESYIRRLDEHISKLEWQSDGHRMWYTHKNPYGCWICQLLQVVRCLRDIAVAPGVNEGTNADEDGYLEETDIDEDINKYD